jgi:hypothetical protein
MKLNCESLPSRDNPSAAVSLAAGVLTITAEPGGSIVSVSGSAAITVSDQTGPLGTFTDVASVRFNGSASNDVFVNASTLPSFAIGDVGDLTNSGGFGENDYFYGGPESDVFIGSRNGGSLFIDNFPVGDVMIGGTGNDFFLASGGGDRIYTGTGFNYVYAPNGFFDLHGEFGYGVVFKGAGGEIVNLNPGIKVIDL